MRRKSRVDANQKQIVDALRKAGRSVFFLHTVGCGCPDLLVGFRGRNFLLEVKIEKGKLTEMQEELIQRWNGTIYVVRSVDEALKVTDT